MAFAAMLKQLREEKRLSQKDIADYLGITRQAVASYELAKREPDYEVLKKLADYFDVSMTIAWKNQLQRCYGSNYR